MTTRRIGGRRPNAPAVEPYRANRATALRLGLAVPMSGAGATAPTPCTGRPRFRNVSTGLGELSRNPANRAVLDRRTTLGQMIRAMMGEILAYVPVDTGRLYRSFRIRIHGNGVILWFEAPLCHLCGVQEQAHTAIGSGAGWRRAYARQTGSAKRRRSVPGWRYHSAPARSCGAGRGGATSEVTYEYAFTS